MKIVFSDDTNLLCETVHGSFQYYNGTNRDSLTFIFPEDFDLTELINKFIPRNCRKIWLEDESGGKFLHEHYTIRFAIGVKERGFLINAGENADHRIVNYVTMLQTTYAEQQLEELSDVVDALLVSQLEGGNDNG